MADIRVKPIKRRPIWLWLFVVLLVAVAIGAYLAFGRPAAPATLTLLPL